MRLESNVSWVPPSVRLLYPVTGVSLSVNENEPVMAVQESYGMNEAGTGDHRYQVLLMPAGNTLTAFWTDLGPADAFWMYVEGKPYQAPPYFQLVLMEHSVGECRDMAERGRFDDTAVKLLHEQVSESDLFARYQRLIEEDMAIVRNRSVMGAAGMTQRNGYSAIAARLQQERLTNGNRI